jgi:hypothetical protein
LLAKRLADPLNLQQPKLRFASKLTPTGIGLLRDSAAFGRRGSPTQTKSADVPAFIANGSAVEFHAPLP